MTQGRENLQQKGAATRAIRQLIGLLAWAAAVALMAYLVFTLLFT